MSDHIDAQGFRANVGIILANDSAQVLWAGRARSSGWQFPQGGMRRDETPEQAMYRELLEEVGLYREQVEVLGCTRGWLRYRLPGRFRRPQSQPLCIGQKQRWFLLRLLAPSCAVRFDQTEKPEFDRWRWVDYWHPVQEVIYFKRRVYRRALEELEPFLLAGDGAE